MRERTLEDDHTFYADVGRDDYVLGRLFKTPKHQGWELASQEQAQAWYSEGWNAALQEEKVKGRALFLLDELLARMRTGDEWYGSDFDDPMTIVERIKASLNEN